MDEWIPEYVKGYRQVNTVEVKSENLTEYDVDIGYELDVSVKAKEEVEVYILLNIRDLIIDEGKALLHVDYSVIEDEGISNNYHEIIEEKVGEFRFNVKDNEYVTGNLEVTNVDYNYMHQEIPEDGFINMNFENKSYNSLRITIKPKTDPLTVKESEIRESIE